MTCPVCAQDGCPYWQLHRAQSWHPPPAGLGRPAGIPPDSLRPLWRCTPGRSGVAVVALDPREALVVLANGCTIDGRPHRASLEGQDGRVEADGRVAVRIAPVELLPTLAFVDSGRTS